MTRTAQMRWLTAVFAVAVLSGCGSSSAKSAGTSSTTAPSGPSSVATTTSAASADKVDLTFTGAVKLHAVGTKVHTCGARAAQGGANGDAGVEVGDAEYPGIGKYMSIEGTILPSGKALLQIIKWADSAGTANINPTDNDAHTTFAVSGASPGKVTVRFANAKFKNDKTQAAVTVNGSIVCTG